MSQNTWQLTSPVGYSHHSLDNFLLSNLQHHNGKLGLRLDGLLIEVTKLPSSPELLNCSSGTGELAKTRRLKSPKLSNKPNCVTIQMKALDGCTFPHPPGYSYIYKIKLYEYVGIHRMTTHVHLFLVILTLTRDIHLQNKLRKRTNLGEKSLD